MDTVNTKDLGQVLGCNNYYNLFPDGQSINTGVNIVSPLHWLLLIPRQHSRIAGSCFFYLTQLFEQEETQLSCFGKQIWFSRIGLHTSHHKFPKNILFSNNLYTLSYAGY